MAKVSRDRLKHLAKIPLFSYLDTGELKGVLALFEEVRFEAEEIVCTAGDPGDTFYIVLSGALEAWGGGEEGQLLAELGPADFFGESALILDEPRSATIQAAAESELLALRQGPFERFFLDNAKARAYLEEIRRQRNIRAIEKIPAFSFLDPEELIELEKLFEEQDFAAGDVVFTAGERGETFYVVLKGELEVWAGDGAAELVGCLGPPNFFGEQALLLDVPRSATVRVSERATLLALHRKPFDHFFRDNERALAYFEDVRQNRRIQTLEKIPLFSYLSAAELATSVGLFTEETLTRGEVVCTAGDEGDAFYVVLTGALEVWGGKKGRQLLATMGPSDFFGEESLLLGEPRGATIIVSQETRVLVLRKEPFDRFFLHNEKALNYLAEVRHRRRVAALQRIPLFNFLTPEELGEIHQLFVEETFRKGDTICRAGDESHRFYIILSGELEVWTGGDEARRIARLKSGDFFGELALVLGERRTATVLATQRTQLLGLDKEAFSRFFLHNARALEYFSKIMCQRLASTVSGEQVGEGTVQIAVASRSGLKGTTMVATAVAALLKALTDEEVLLVHLRPALPDGHDPDIDFHLANLDRSIERVRRSFEQPSETPIELTVGIIPDNTAEGYGERLSELVTRLREDFHYQVFDLGSDFPAVAASARDFVDVLVEIVDQAEPWFGRLPRSGAENGDLVRYPVVNLANPRSRRVPVSSCVPFVLPHDPALARDGVLEHPRSPAAIPLWRLTRKILGRTVGLALGGGAAFGLSHLGVLKVLEDNEIPVDLLVGCSMGSLVAVSYAAGFGIDQMIAKAHDMGRMGYMATGLDFTLLKPGILAGDKLKARFSPLLGDCRVFEDLLVPCRTVATDIQSGELVTIGRGRLEDAYRSSSAVPVVLSPEALDGRVLVDGGVADPVPAETARDMGADLVIAINVVPPLKRGVETVISKWTGRLNRLNPIAYLAGGQSMPNSFDITMNSLQTLQHELGAYKAISADVSIQPDLSDFTWTDFHRSHELIERGAEAAERALPEIRKLSRLSEA